MFTSGGTHPLKVKFIYDKADPAKAISNWYKKSRRIIANTISTQDWRSKMPDWTRS